MPRPAIAIADAKTLPRWRRPEALPAPLGLLWLTAPGADCGLAALLALVSLVLASLVPRHPTAGNETALSARALTQPGE